MATGANQHDAVPSREPSPWRPDHDHSGADVEIPVSPLSDPGDDPVGPLPAPQQRARPAPEPTLTKNALSWRPFYLRRFVLASFAFTFALSLVAIEVLLAVSNQNYGLGAGYQGQHYLWTYGPTAFLTLVAALWGRTEYQSKLAAPWIRLLRQPARPDQGLLLDYVSDFQPYSIFKALRNKDFVVAITSTISVLIKILIIVSTGLITLSQTAVTHDSFPMIAQDTFVPDPARLSEPNTVPFYTMVGLAGRNLSYEDGFNDRYAFQSVDRGTLPVTAETTVTVDGLTNTLDCESATATLLAVAPIDPREAVSGSPRPFNFTISSPSCNIQNQHFDGPPWACGGADNCTQLFGRADTVQCDGSDKNDEDGRRIFLIFGNFTYAKDLSHSRPDRTGQTKQYDYFSTLHQSAQVLCRPSYTVSKVNVVRNGTTTLSVAPALSGSSVRTLEGIGPWDMWNAQQRSLDNPIVDRVPYTTYGMEVSVSDGGNISVDKNTQYALQTQFEPGTPIASLFEQDSLREMTVRFYQQSAALVAKTVLLQPGSAAVNASVVITEDRLVVRSWAAQWMAGLTAACLVLAVVAVFLVPSHGILPTNPSTIPAMASILAGSQGLTSRLQFSGATDDKGLGNMLRGSMYRAGVLHDPTSNQYRFSVADTHNDSPSRDRDMPRIRALQAHPAIVHPATRITVALVLIGLIVALEMLLRKSNNENGLGDVGDDTFIHYTWTALPALALGTLAMVVSAMDFRVRSLVPYTALTKSVTAERLMGLEFLDMSLPRIIWKELRFVNIGALATTLAFLITSLFTIFSSSLYHPEAFAGSGSLTLRANQSFSPELLEKNDALISSTLIFVANATYPKFTYENLAFMELVASNVSMPQDTKFDPSTISIGAVVPAVRGRMDCREYGSDKIRTNHTRDYKEIYISNPLGVFIDGEGCGRVANRSDGESIHDGWLPTFPNMTYFGAASQSNQAQLGEIRGCSDHVYIWGKLDYAANPSVVHIAAMGCNVTYEAVDVDTTFRGAGLDIDPTNPPRPREETVRNSSVPRFIPAEPSPINFQDLLYYGLASPPVGTDNLHPFFGMVTNSRWAIPRDYLGDPGKDGVVGESIKFHHGIILAQLLNTNRQPANVSNATLANPQPGDNEGAIVLDATASEPEARRRVVQDTVSTRILQALLGATLALLTAGWILMRHTAVLAGSPTSIGARAAVLAGGNLLDRLPPGCEWMSQREVKVALGERTRFWMGWGTAPDEHGDVSSRFGIFAVDEGRDSDHRSSDEEQKSGVGVNVIERRL
ncbi:hypothetical protein QBC47DRAFT_373646, partial [Echria macrotheca]